MINDVLSNVLDVALVTALGMVAVLFAVMSREARRAKARRGTHRRRKG